MKWWEDKIMDWKELDFASSNGAAENRTRCKGIVIVICGAPTASQSYAID